MPSDWSLHLVRPRSGDRDIAEGLVSEIAQGRPPFGAKYASDSDSAGAPHPAEAIVVLRHVQCECDRAGSPLIDAREFRTRSAFAARIVAADRRHPRLKISHLAADARHVAAIARLSRAKRSRFGTLFDGILQRLCDLAPVQSVLGAVVVYVVWGLALPILPGAGTIGFISFATEGTLFAGVVLFARAIPLVEARLRRQQLQLTTNLRRLSGREHRSSWQPARRQPNVWVAEQVAQGLEKQHDDMVDSTRRDCGLQTLESTAPCAAARQSRRPSRAEDSSRY
jgi:hypothetical protein